MENSCPLPIFMSENMINLFEHFRCDMIYLRIEGLRVEDSCNTKYILSSQYY